MANEARIYQSHGGLRRRGLPFGVMMACVALLAGCALAPQHPPCPAPVPEKAPLAQWAPAQWADLPGWEDDDHAEAFELFRRQCSKLGARAAWKSSCAAAQETEASKARAFFEREFRPWALADAQGNAEGLITGYFEPIVRGSRTRTPPYTTPMFAPPDDLIVVELGALYPELQHYRLRGRLEGRRLTPYFSRTEWEEQQKHYFDKALVWLDDPLAAFFLEIQGSGLIELDDGSRLRIGYADQNGHPYRSIGKWLIEQGELAPHEATMQGIRAWALAHPERLKELLARNPSLVFFRELPVEGAGPPGALGLPLTPERSLAVDPRIIPLGSPVWLATTWPDASRPLQRLMLAQDTGGAIKGAVRADFFWGSGEHAGAWAGRMKQKGRLWVLLPRNQSPEAR
ncbi:MAG: MltA domain-containing protein [Rhodocyclaceae bacterium]|nr:MltA domain-containing protein [Rhodocyclaceae bacterium]